jgi:hypothetical protein
MVSDSPENIVPYRPQRRTDKEGVILCPEPVEYVHIWLAMTQQLGELLKNSSPLRQGQMMNCSRALC